MNSTDYNTFYLGGPTGITGGSVLPGIPVQNASDVTSRAKNVYFYRGYAGSRFNPGTNNTADYNNPFNISVDFSIAQSNQNTKTYQLGKLICLGCTGAFPTAPIGN